jgi:predicted nucleic acid-binding protein
LGLKLVLDTNAYCDFAEGLPAVVQIIATSDDLIFIPSIVIGELSYGFMKGSRREVNEMKLRQIIEDLRIEIINVDESVARKYGTIYSSLVRKGNKFPINDVWIAACCMEVGGTLITRDRHFEAVEQIETLMLTSQNR